MYLASYECSFYFLSKTFFQILQTKVFLTFFVIVLYSVTFSTCLVYSFDKIEKKQKYSERHRKNRNPLELPHQCVSLIVPFVIPFVLYISIGVTMWKK